MSKKIGVLVGSLRKGSYSKKLANQLVKLAPKSLEFTILNMGHLPLYNQDFDDEGTPPKEWLDFRAEISACDGLLFVTPEYNRSVPGVLKNAIDVGSRPYGKSVWNKKPGAVVSISVGGIGGFGANHHLRQSLVFLNIPTMQAPEAYIGGAAELFDTNDELIKEDTAEFLTKFMAEFANWVARTCSN